MSRPKSQPRIDEQGQTFIRKARELGCDEDPEAFERVFARVVPPKKPPDSRAPEKTGPQTRRRHQSSKGQKAKRCLA